MPVHPILFDRQVYCHPKSKDDPMDSCCEYVSSSNLLKDTEAKKPRTIPIFSSKDDFQVNLDVHHFKLEEMSVKVVDGFLIIEAGHDERKDDIGWVTRQFTRRYALPENCNIEGIQSRLFSNTILSVTALSNSQTDQEIPVTKTDSVRTQIEDRSQITADPTPEIQIDTPIERTIVNHLDMAIDKGSNLVLSEIAIKTSKPNLRRETIAAMSV